MYFFKIIFIASFIFLASCSNTSYNHQSGNNSYLNVDASNCRTEANVYAPTYICRNPLMCAPDEFQVATQALIRNANYYKMCMQSKGYQKY